MMSFYRISGKFLTVLLAAVLVGGCSIHEYEGGYSGDSIFSSSTGNTTAKLMDGQKEVQQEFDAGNYDQAAHIVDSLRQHDIYQRKDRVLYTLDKGTIDYFRGDYQQSVESYRDAERYIDQLFTKNAKRGFKAFFTNDTQLAYNGEVYEGIYLNGFSSLDYLNMGKFDEALVEARQIVQQLEQVEAKYEKLAESYQQSAMAIDRADSAQRDMPWNTGQNRIQDSPFSHYLSGVLYAKSGSHDDARIELKNMQTAVKNQQLLPDSRVSFDPAFNQITKPATYNTLLTAFSGMAPEKVEERMGIEDINESVGLGFVSDSTRKVIKNAKGATFEIAVPKLEMHPSKVAKVEATLNDTLLATLPLVEEMDKVAKETFEAKRPIIITRAFFSELIAFLPQTEKAEQVRQQDEDNLSGSLREGLAKLSSNMQKVGDQADLRGWNTMPGKVYSNVVKLPSGEHTITFKYYSDNGELLYTANKKVTVKENESLASVSSLYSN